MHPTLAWILVGWNVLGMFLTVLTIGRKREPITPPVAAISLVISAAYIFALFYATGLR